MAVKLLLILLVLLLLVLVTAPPPPPQPPPLLLLLIGLLPFQSAAVIEPEVLLLGIFALSKT